jgi:hypothetical protein
MKQVDLIFLILFTLALVSGGALMYLVISFKKLFPRENKDEIPGEPQYEDYEGCFYNPEM